MSPKEFVNFLNGAIELGNINQLDNNSFKIVNDKVVIIKNDSTPEGIFCTWLKGFLEAAENPSVSPNQFVKITTKLYEVSQQLDKKKSHDNGNLVSSKVEQPFSYGDNTRC